MTNYKRTKGVHRTKFAPERDRVAQIDNRTPVLLKQGFGFVAGSPGTVARFDGQISTGRGRAKYIDIYPFFFGGTPNIFDQDVPFSIEAGGQVLLEDTNLGIWNFDTQLGKDKRHKIRVTLDDAQTFSSILDITNGTSIQAVTPIVYYTTDAYEHFLKHEFRLRWGLGLKRRTYRLNAPNGAPVDTSITETLPRNNGPIIAVGVHSSSTITDLRNLFHDVFIDGIRIIEEVPGFDTAVANGREGYILPVNIRPGAEMQFRTFGDLTVAGNPVAQYITFYFGN